MKSIIRLILIVTVSFSGCNDGHKEKKTIVIAICDTSNSAILQDTNQNHRNRMNKLKEITRKLPSLYPLGSKIYYYPVSSNRLSDPFVSEISYTAKTQSQIKEDKANVDSLLKLLSIQLDSVALITPNSCIISSIKAGVDKIQDISNQTSAGEYNYELVIISDMLEDCKRSSGPHIEMSLRDTAKFNKAILQLSKEDLQINSSSSNFKIWVILTSPKLDDQIDRIRQAWIDCFILSGIEKDRIKITCNIPQSVIRKIQY